MLKPLVRLLKSDVQINLRVGFFMGIVGFMIFLAGFTSILLKGFGIIDNAGGYIGPLFFSGAMLVTLSLLISFWNSRKNESY